MTSSENSYVSRSGPHPAVHARRIHFNYPVASLDRHYVQGDLVMSHLIAHLS